MCMELIENAVGAGHKVLLFSQFTSMLERLAAGLKKAGIDYYMLTGSVGKEKRMQMVESFNEDDVPVFCISLKAGGTGLNLTAADIVIHYDPWWNLAVQNQATDRAHRIGQKNVVNVYKLIAKDTIEENIVKLNNQTYDVKGYLSLHDLNDYLDLDLDSEDFDSVGGLVIDALGRLPQTNDETTLPNGIRIKVLKVEKNRIESVRLILPDTLTQKDV